MRFSRYLKEDVIKTAINIEEPKVGRKYSDKLVTKRIDIIQSAIKKLEGKVDDESTEAIMADLEDKRGKWSNVDKETEAPKAVAPPETAGEEEPPPEGEEQDQGEIDKEKVEKEKEEDEKDQEKVDKETEKKEIDSEERGKKREEKRDKNAEARDKAKEEKKKKKEKVKENRAIDRIIKTRIKLK